MLGRRNVRAPVRLKALLLLAALSLTPSCLGKTAGSLTRRAPLPPLRQAGERQEVRGEKGRGKALEDVSSLVARAEAAYRSGQLDEARGLLEQAIRLDPRSARAHALLGLVLVRQNAIQPALCNLGEAHEIEPANPDYAYDYAVLLLQVRQFSAAAPILESLHQQSPQAEDILVNLARAYAGAHESGKLSAISSSLPSGDYKNQSLLKALATILASDGQVPAVERLWKAAIDHDPSLPLPYAALAELWTARGEPSRALALLAGAPAAARGPLYLYAEGETQLALRNYNEAIESFRTLTRQLPADEAAWLQLVKCCLVAGRLADAQQAAGQASQQFPDVIEFPYQRAVANYMLGRSALAISELKPVLEKENGRDVRPLLLMAVLESGAGNYQNAARYFAQAEQMNPGCNALASYFYGATLLRMHQLRQAQTQLQTAIRCRPHFALAEFRLGQALSEDGKSHEALMALERATHDDPALAEPYYALAQIRRRLGDAQGARAALRQFNKLHKHVTHSDRELFRPTVVGN
jgi:tetratricopeptide (TPR) repeat protein